MKNISKMKIVYFIVFASLALWALFAYFTMNQLINSQRIYAKIINISGQQRMLSQKTTLIAKRYYEEKNQFLLNHAISLFEKMKENHNFISTNLTSKNMKDIYYGQKHSLNDRVYEYFDFYNKFLVLQSEDSLKNIEKFSFELLPELNFAVLEFEKESNEKINDLKKRELLIFIGTMLTLILEAYLIVIPSLRLNEEREEFLTNQNEILEERLQEELKKLQEKDKIINEQSKMMLMREMLINLSHQYRQPLSIISTIASGMKLKKEFNQLDDRDFEDGLNIITKNSEHLSKTIDNLRVIFENKDEMTAYNFQKIFNNLKDLLKEKLNSNDIKLLMTIENINYYGHENKFSNAILHIINNAIDILKDKDDTRLIFVKVYKKSEIIIEIKDNGGGIEEKIKNKIFEPFVTSKKDSIGKGLDLYLTKEIIENLMKGQISVSNIEFEYKKENYKGALFKITLPCV